MLGIKSGLLAQKKLPSPFWTSIERIKLILKYKFLKNFSLSIKIKLN
jgi:hypothetical protein